MNLEEEINRLKSELNEKDKVILDLRKQLNEQQNLYQKKEIERNRIIVDLYKLSSNMTDKELYDFALDKAVKLTESKVGFFHQISDNQDDIILTTWNDEALKSCNASYDVHYPVSQAGNWVDCLQTKTAVIYNDYQNSPNQKGMPEGHNPITRFMSIPVIENGKVRLIFGVGNKESNYIQKDANELELVANELYKIISKRRYERELLESNMKFETILENITDGVTVMNPEGKIIYANHKIAFDSGFSSPEEFIKEHSWKKMNEILDIRDRFGKPFKIENLPSKIAFTGKKSFPTIFNYIVRGTGENRWSESQATPIFDKDGKLIFVITVTHQITDFKQAEEALRHNEKTLKSLINSFNESVLLIDTDGIIIVANETASKRMNHAFDSIVGLNAYNLVPAKVRKDRMYFAEEVIRTKREIIFIDERFGRIIQNHINPVLDEKGDVSHLAIVGIDITENRRNYEKILQSERILEQTETISHVGGWEFDLATRITTWTNEVYKIYGVERNYDPSNIKSDIAFFAQEDQKIIEKAFFDAVNHGNKYDLQLKFRSADGKQKWVRTIGTPIYEQGKITRIVGIIADVTELVELQEEIQKRAVHWKKTFDTVSDSIIILDANQRILQYNRSTSDILSLGDKDITGKHCYDIIHYQNEPIEACPFKLMRENKSRVLSEVQLNDKWYEVTVDPIFESGNTIVGAVHIIRNINERKIAEEQARQLSERFRRTFDLSPVGSLIVGLDRKFIICNKAFADFLKYRPEELIGKFIEDVTYPADVPVGMMEMKQLVNRETETVTFQKRYMTSLGEVVWGEISISIVNDSKGMPQFFLPIVIDITTRKQAEEEINNLLYEIKIKNDLLESAINFKDSLLIQIEKTNNRLKEIIQEKDKFFSVISHDLRGPLGVFKDSVELLYDDYDSFAEEEIKSFLLGIKNSAANIFELLENLLIWSRSQRGIMDFKPELANIFSDVNEIAQLYRPIADNKNIIIKTESDNIPGIFYDRNMIKTVLRNLISNAVKFSNFDSFVNVNILNEGNYLSVCVEDNGIGIDDEIRDKLFRIGEDVVNIGTNNEKGTGLGLILCKEFIERHRGKIELSSEKGKGSKFTFSLPVRGDLIYEL